MFYLLLGSILLESNQYLVIYPTFTIILNLKELILRY
jgi:hypothetical protein